jgi:hypothetical protein
LKTRPALAVLSLLTLVLLLGLAAACDSAPDAIDESGRWVVVHSGLPGALTSVWGTGPDNVWAVGSDPGDGSGPTVMNFDGDRWFQLETGHSGDLWWVFGFEGGPIFLGGKDGLILRFERGEFQRMETPGAGTVYGIWGTAPDDLWAVGGTLPTGAFAWRFDGTSWRAAQGYPTELAGSYSMFKVWGKAGDDVWMIGTGGVAVHYDGAAFKQEPSGTDNIIFTVHADSEIYAAVGGLGVGVILENDGSGWKDVTPKGTPHVMGVWLGGAGGYAAGVDGTVLRREPEGWTTIDTGIPLKEAFHAVWVDPDGGVWTAGGQVLAPPLADGVMIYRSPNGSTDPG